MAAEALQALNRILKHRETRERLKLQETLSFMQFAQQKRASEIKEFGQQMEVVSNANKQLKYNVANEFLAASGLQSILDVVPTGLQEVSEIEDSLEDIVKILRKKDNGKFNKSNAEDIASVLWSYKNTEQPSSIIGLANRIESMYAPGYKGTSDDRDLLNSFQKISNLAQLRSVGKQAQLSLKNDKDILKEQFQFAKGDTKIQSGFGIIDDSVVNEYLNKTKPDDKDLANQNLNIKSIADLVESEVEDPTEYDALDTEIKGHNIFRKGYDSPTNQELTEQALDFLTESEVAPHVKRLESINQKQSDLKNNLSTLIDELEDKKQEYAEIEENKNKQWKRYSYFKGIEGQESKAEESLKLAQEYGRQLEDRYNWNKQGSAFREKHADDLINRYGYRGKSNISQYVSGTKRAQIEEVKESIRKLENERLRLAGAK